MLQGHLRGRSLSELTFIDLCSGAGLFSAGFVEAGFTPVLAVDVDPLAIESYRQNVSACARVGTIADHAAVPKSSVLIAGPPCQGFSTLGRQDPLDVRNQLSRHIPYWANQSGCSVVVIENVPPFLASKHWQALADDLIGDGFEITTWVLDAVDFGTPQFRKRAFTVGSKIGSIHAPSPTARRVTAGEILNRPIAAGDPMHRWPTPVGVAAERIAMVPLGGDKRDILRKRPDICPPSWQKVGCQATDVWGRLHVDEPANTIRCTFQNPSKGRYLHPSENRTLSLREGARLQGVPDKWTFVGRPYPVARQIGNGVPIQLAAAVAGSVARAFEAAGLKQPAATLKRLAA